MEPQAPQTSGEAPRADAAPQESQQQSTENAQPQQPVAPQPPPDIPEEYRGIAHVQDGKVVVPIDAVIDERRKRQEHEDRLRKQDQELFLMRQFQYQPPPQQQQSQPDEFKLPDDLAKMADDEVVNGAEMKRALRHVYEMAAQRMAAPQQNERQQEMIGETMIQSMDPQGVNRLQAGIQQIAANPMLQQQMRMVNPMLRPFIAYRMGYGENFQQAAQAAVAQTGQMLQPQQMPQQQYGYPQQPPPPNPAYQQVANQPMNYQQVAANQNIPPATSAVGGSTPVNQARYWATAPREEFERKLQQIKNGQG